jgi:hypothetical protein
MRYETDLTDREWNLIAPVMPPAAKTGRPRRWSLREIMNAIFYVMRGAIQELRWKASCSVYAKLADLGAAKTEEAAKAFEAHQHLLAADLALGRLGNFKYRRAALHDIAG